MITNYQNLTNKIERLRRVAERTLDKDKNYSRMMTCKAEFLENIRDDMTAHDAGEYIDISGNCADI